MKEKLRSFVDQIFNPIHSILDLGKEKLQDINLVTAQGLDVSGYLSIFGDMPQIWQVTISSLLGSTVLLLSLLIFRSIFRIYFAIKGGVKWW
ncbi:hypothetical protein U3A55_02440 [Salarchaeum sp. III]|uniref:hypothetical protein n=1 Tax=Salarchaeum sp. III TaxID=3107927 RepID=UPI002EDB4C3A